MPPLPALLADPPRQVLSNLCPLLRAEQLHKLEDKAILFLGPRALHEVRVQHFLPAVEALDVCAPRKELSYPFPVLSIVFCNRLSQLQVFFLRPVAFQDIFI